MKATMIEQGNAEIFKSLRIMGLNKDYSLMIQYGETIKSNWEQGHTGAIFGIKVIRESEIRDNEI
jgi:hypothetical protein